MTIAEPDIEAAARGSEQVRTVMQVTWSLVAGGAEMYAYTIASHLDSRRYRSVMCAVDQGGALEPEIVRSRIPHVVMNRRQGIDLRLMWRMYRLFRKMRVDVVHTHHFAQLFYSVLGARLAGARIIHTEHAVADFNRPRLQKALRVLSRFCAKVTAVAPDGAHALESGARIPGDKIEVMRAGVDLNAFDESKEHARQALGLGESDRVATIVARLYPEKNHKLLLEAFAEVTARLDDARLLIVGEGTEQESIREIIIQLGLSGHVQMMGVRRDIARILAASDLFVLASDREGLPIAALEAMAAGKPVVSTKVGDLPSIVRDGETGRLVNPGDRGGLAGALLDLLSAPKAAEQMGQKAREIVEQGYSVESMIARYDRLYSK